MTALQRDEARALDAGRDVDRDNIGRLAFGTGEELPFDASGRFILPAFYRETAGLTDLAFFIGIGERFEIWNPQAILKGRGRCGNAEESCRLPAFATCRAA